MNENNEQHSNSVTDAGSGGSGLLSIFESTTGAIAAVGGIATGAYAAGYAYQWAYLAHFRAEWLVGELNTAEVLFNSGVILTIIGIFIGAAVASVLDRTPDVPRLIRHAYLSFVGVVLLIIADSVLQYRISVLGRAIINANAVFLLTLATIELAKIGSLHLSYDTDVTRRDTVGATTLSVFLVFALIPGMFGKTHAVYKRSDVTRLMPVATVQTKEGARELPLLFAGNERAYCLTGKDHRTIVPVEWEAVIAVAGRRARG